MTTPDTIRTRVLIIGGGIAGIGAGAMLADESIDDYILLEKSDGLGGTWHHNRYPGCACDIPSPIYQFRFHMNPRWSRLFAPQEEIRQYVNEVADQHGVTCHTRFGVEVTAMTWDDERHVWTVETNQGAFDAPFVVLATGSLHNVKVSEIEGADTFEGTTMHTARWNHEWDAAGQRVAVIGTGASSIQVTPELIKVAERLTLFQRTPAYILPKNNSLYGPLMHTLLRVPGAQVGLRGMMWFFADVLGGATYYRPRASRIAARLCRNNLRKAVPDEVLRAKLQPTYEFGCKRPLLSDNFYESLQQPNAELVDAGVVRITKNSVVAATGEEREVDAIVFATGFEYGVGPLAEKIRGKGGISLKEIWCGQPRGYLGTTMSGFPNLVLMWGPNTGTGSIALSIEAQLRHVRTLVRAVQRDDVRSLDVRPEHVTAFKREVDDKSENSLMRIGGCVTWYLDETGSNQVLWPGNGRQMAQRMERAGLEAYEVVTHPTGTRQVGAACH